MPLPPDNNETEVNRIREAYARRRDQGLHSRYRTLAPAAILTLQERERGILNLLRRLEPTLGSLEELSLLEVGCGSGGNLLDCLRWGFQPENLAGNELLEDRIHAAQRKLPGTVRFFAGDATRLENMGGPYDIVLQATVFTSILDPVVRQSLAERIWCSVKPGGGVLWYDFAFNNPRNPDVRGIKAREIRELFPAGQVETERITLAPPLARLLSRVHPGLYSIFNTLPWLRTHVLAWIQKPSM